MLFAIILQVLLIATGLGVFVLLVQTIYIESKLLKEERRRRNEEIKKEVEWWREEELTQN